MALFQQNKSSDVRLKKPVVEFTSQRKSLNRCFIVGNHKLQNML